MVLPGKVYEDMDQPSLALECYLRALEYEGGNWDYEFWGRLYNQIGRLYAEQELYGKAMSFEKSECPISALE